MRLEGVRVAPLLSDHDSLSHLLLREIPLRPQANVPSPVKPPWILPGGQDPLWLSGICLSFPAPVSLCR